MAKRTIATNRDKHLKARQKEIKSVLSTVEKAAKSAIATPAKIAKAAERNWNQATRRGAAINKRLKSRKK